MLIQMLLKYAGDSLYGDLVALSDNSLVCLILLKNFTCCFLTQCFAFCLLLLFRKL